MLCVYVMLVGHAFQTNPHEHNGESAAHEHKGHEKTLSNMPMYHGPVPSRPALRNPPRPEMNLSSNDAAIQRPGQSAQPPYSRAAATAAASQSTRARVNGTRRARARCIRLSTKPPPPPPPRRWKLFPQFTTTTDEQRTGAGAYITSHRRTCRTIHVVVLMLLLLLLKLLLMLQRYSDSILNRPRTRTQYTTEHVKNTTTPTTSGFVRACAVVGLLLPQLLVRLLLSVLCCSVCTCTLGTSAHHFGTQSK